MYVSEKIKEKVGIWIRVLHKLTVARLVKDFPSFCGTGILWKSHLQEPVIGTHLKADQHCPQRYTLLL